MKSLIRRSVKNLFSRSSVVRRAGTVSLFDATRSVLEQLEKRQMMAADLGLSATRLLYTEVRGGAASAAQKVTLTNIGDAPLNIGSGGITLTGGDAAIFQFSPSPTLPAALNPGESADVFVAFNPLSATTTGVKTTTLRIVSDDADTPTLDVALRGLATAGTSGTNEPSLQRVLDLWQIPVNNGDTNPATTQLFGNSPLEPLGPSDEVRVQSLVKAGDGPVTVNVLGVYGVASNPALRFGYYSAGTNDSKQQLFTIPTSQAQSVTVTPNGVTSFDPGASKFGLYTVWPGFTDSGMQRETYSEDQLNQYELTAANQRKYRFYQMKNPDGSTVANTYVVAVEEFVNDVNASYDNQDIVFTISNVTAAPSGPEIGLENRDGRTLAIGQPGSDRLVFGRIQTPDTSNPNLVKDTGVIRIRNTGDSVLTVSNLLITEVVNGVSVTPTFTIVNPPTYPLSIAAGAFLDVTVKFIAQTTRVHNGTLQIFSNDSDEPVTSVALSGLWQSLSENGVEPTIKDLVSAFGITTTIVGSGQSLDRGGIVEAVGEEVLSPYWYAADPTQPVNVRQMAAYHTQGNTAALRYFFKPTPGTLNALITHNNLAAQMILPYRSGSTTDPANANFTPNPTNPFGFKIDNESSDPTLNVQETAGGGYGHHIRFWPVRDRTGRFVPNTYVMAMDYNGINYDFQDNLYIVSNIRPELIPGSPSNVNAIASGAGVNVTWNANPEANVAGYNVYRSTNAGSGFVKVNGTSLVTGTSFNDPSVARGANYFYRVTAVFTNNVEGLGTGTRAIVLPGTVSGVAVSVVNGSSIQVRWSDQPNESAYKIERSLDGTTWSPLVTTAANVVNYTDTGLSQTIRYYYRVRATNSVGDGVNSATVSTVIPVPPSAPAGLNATASGPNQVNLTWNDVTTETGYRVERSADGSTSWASIGTTAASVVTFSDTTVDSNVTYFYRVFAFSVSGDSPASSTVSATTPALAPSAPTGLTATPTGFSTATLSWTDVSGDNGYKIEQTLDGVNWTQIGTTARNVVTFNVTGLLGNATYSYRVRATNGAGDSPYSAVGVLVMPAFTQQIIDNSDTTGVTVTGAWTVLTSTALVNGTALGDNNTAKGSRSVRYTPAMPAGTYEVFARWAAYFNRSTAVPIDITSASGTTTVFVNQQINNAVWVSLGTYTFNEGQGSVTIKNDGTTGVVLADAVRFLSTLPVPTAPTTLVAAPASSSSVNLTWTDNASNESGYKIERMGPSESVFTQIGIASADATSFTVTGLLAGSGYTFRVRAFNVSGDSAYSNQAAATTLQAPPAAPSGLSVGTVTSTSVALSWIETSANETGFKIERRLAGGVTWTEVGQVGANVTSFVDNGLTSEQGYVYRVYAFNTAGPSATTSEVSATTALAPPSGLTGSAVTGSQINLSWTDNSSAETGYVIERQAAGESGFSVIATLGANTTGYNDTGLSIATSYTYRVRATGTSPASSDNVTSAAITTSAASLPSAPTGLGATVNGSTQITLNWTDASNNETGFKILAKSASAPDFTLLNTIGANLTSFIVTGLLPNTAYTFRVFSTNSGGDSSSFAETTATTGDVTPAAPTTLVGSATSASRVSLTWSDRSTNETGFKIFRKAPADSGFVLLTTTAAGATSFLDTNLTANTPYFYQVVATNSGGDSAPSNTATVATPAFIEQVIDNTDTTRVTLVGVWNTTVNAGSVNGSAYNDNFAGKGQKSVTYTPALPAGSYEVWARWPAYSNRATNIPYDIVSATGTTTVLVNQQLNNNVWVSLGTFTFNENQGFVRIRTDGTTLAVGADAVRFSATDTAPAAPSGLGGSVLGANSVSLNWTDNSNNELGFEIERSVGGGAFAVVGTTGPGVTSFVDTGLTGATAFTYRVRSFNGTGDSANLTPIVLTTPGDVTPAAPASGASATPFGTSGMTVTWTDNSNNETGFKVQRKSPTDVDFITLTTTAAEVTSFNDTGLLPATTYAYRIVATNSSGDSAASNVASATTAEAAPAAPSGLTATTVSQSRVNLAWTVNSTNETSIKIQRQAPGQSTFTTLITLPAGTTSFSNTSLLANSTYSYRIIASNATGDSAPSNTAQATTLPNVPASPTGLSATAIDANTVTLTWSDVPTETGFKIRRKGPTDSVAVQIGTVGANVLTYTDTTAQPSVTYAYSIVATNTGGDSAAGTAVNVTTPNGVPFAPTNATTTPLSQSSIRVSWTDASLNETGFKIERKFLADANFVEIGTVGANVATFTDTGLAASTTYVYRVRAAGSVGDSGYSNSVNGTTFDPTANVPTNLTGSTISASQITLSWTDASNNESGFKVLRKGPGQSTYTLLGTTAANATTFNDTGLTPSTLYTYVVRAVNSGGDSADSNAVSVWTGAVPDVIIDDTDTTGVTITGTWSTETDPAAYNGTQIKDNNVGQGTRSVRFTPNLVAGRYEVFTRWTADASRATNVPIDITTSTGTTTVTVNQQLNGGKWVSLGVFTFGATGGNVLVRNDGTNGVVVVDAVRFANVAQPTSSWSQVASYPISVGESNGATVGNKMYVFGGYDVYGPVRNSYSYTPTTNTWTRLADLPTLLTHSGTAVVGTDVYFAGGYTGTGSGFNQVFGTTAVWKYNTLTDTYSSFTPLPAARGSGGLVYLQNTNSLYFFGGVATSRVDRGEAWAINLSNPSATWVSIAAMPTPRSHMGYVAYQGKVWAIQGQTSTDATLVTQSAVNSYDPATNKWTTQSGMTPSRSHISAATLVIGNRIVTVGGEFANTKGGTWISSYDPSTSVWSDIGTLPGPRYSGVASLLGDYLYYAVGSGNSGVTSSLFRTKIFN